MKFDLLLAGIVLLFGVFGFMSGAIRQLTHWLGLAAAYAGTRPLAARLTPLAAPELGLSPAVANVLLSIGLSFALFAMGTLLARWLASKLLPGRENGRGDQAFGFALGAAKGGALVYAALALAIFFEKPLTKAWGAPPPAVRESRAVALVRRHDVFSMVPAPALAKLEKLVAGARDPGSLGALENQPELRRLLDDPQLKAALRDETLSSALKSGDLSSLKNDPRLKALLQDPRFSGSGAGEFDPSR